ncbi:30S ribosomal protein S9 [Patescibacteria group bacterium]|nr:30S ribosomal protein S9 [Patescibacteria group bacterium]
MPTETTKPTKKPAAKKPAKEKKVDPEVVEALEQEDAVASKAAKGGSFIPTVGRRKTAIARVRLIKNGRGLITVNGKEMDKFFTTYELREQVLAPLKAVGMETSVDISVRVAGGGVRGQAEAVRHGIARALLVVNETYRTTLKKLGFLTRDSRKRERKKFGLKSARRAPQWSKR